MSNFCCLLCFSCKGVERPLFFIRYHIHSLNGVLKENACVSHPLQDGIKKTVIGLALRYPLFVVPEFYLESAPFDPTLVPWFGEWLSTGNR